MSHGRFYFEFSYWKVNAENQGYIEVHSIMEIESLRKLNSVQENFVAFLVFHQLRLYQFETLQSELIKKLFF